MILHRLNIFKFYPFSGHCVLCHLIYLNQWFFLTFCDISDLILLDLFNAFSVEWDPLRFIFSIFIGDFLVLFSTTYRLFWRWLLLWVLILLLLILILVMTFRFMLVFRRRRQYFPWGIFLKCFYEFSHYFIAFNLY